MASTSSVRLAVIDDYAGIAKPYFERLDGLQIDHFPETLNAATPDGLEALVDRLQPYQVISSLRERTAFPADLLNRLPHLKLVLNAGGRNKSIDMDCTRERGVIVTGTKGERPTDPKALEALPDLPPPNGHSAVVQHAWALLLALCSRIPEDANALERDAKAWQTGTMTTVAGKTLGILGLGKLGVGMAKIGVLAFGMSIIAWSENLTQERAHAAAEDAGLPRGSFEAVSKEELFRKSDFVALHNVLSPRSKGTVGARELSWMKRSAMLVNTSRGPLIDEQALIDVLKAGRIRGVALDVFWEEPLSPNSPWRSASSWSKSGLVLSPHMGYVNEGTLNRWYQEQAEELERWMRGEEPLHRLN